MRSVPHRTVGDVEQDRRVHGFLQIEGRVDVIPVSMGAGDRDDAPVRHGVDDRRGVMGGVDHDDLGVATHDPHVVLYLLGADTRTSRVAIVLTRSMRGGTWAS